MTTTGRRIDRCSSLIDAALEQIRKNNSADAVMASLEDHFLSFSGILESSEYMLVKEGLTESEARLLSLIPDLTRYSMREKFGAHPKIDRFSIAGEYLRTLYVGVPVEQFHVMHLDANGRLIQCNMLQQGSVDETPFYIDHLLQDVIFSGAKAIVLSHNHPGGTLRPSKADISTTLNAISALLSMDIPLLDHIIIADGQPVSIRSCNATNMKIWLAQDPSSALLRNWMDVEI